MSVTYAAKYGNRKTQIDNVVFDSYVEAERYLFLKARMQAREITGLALQPKYELQPSFKRNGKTVKAITYTADFEYFEGETCVVEDVKGFETQQFRLRQKMFLYHYPEHDLRIVKGAKKRRGEMPF